MYISTLIEVENTVFPAVKNESLNKNLLFMLKEKPLHLQGQDNVSICPPA